MARLAVTTVDTKHGLRAELLPAGTTIKVKKAHNQPKDGDIQYWAYPAKGHAWNNKNLKAHADGYGVGLSESDVKLLPKTPKS